MSYIYTENNHNIYFKNELSFLNARMEYLQGKENGWYSSFTSFIEQHQYDSRKCEIEKIEHISPVNSYTHYTDGNIWTDANESPSIDYDFDYNSNTWGDCDSFYKNSYSLCNNEYMKKWDTIFKINFKQRTKEVKEIRRISRFDILDIGD